MDSEKTEQRIRELENELRCANEEIAKLQRELKNRSPDYAFALRHAHESLEGRLALTKFSQRRS